MQDQHGLASTALVETPVGRVRLPARLQQFLQRSRDNQSIILHVTGSAKREVLEQAWATQSLPIASILRQELVPLEIYIDQPLELV